MKILLVHNFYQYWGGEDTYVTALKKLLEENGHKIYLYSKNNKTIKTFWDKIKTAIGLFYNPSVKKELAKIIKEFKPDVAHFHNVYPLITTTAYIACKQNNIPIIQHVHNYRFMCPKGILFRDRKICELCLYKKFSFWSVFFGCYHQSRLASLFFSLSFFYSQLIKTFILIDKFIFPASFTRDYYLKYLPIPLSKTVIIPHFVGTNIEKNQKIEEKGDYFLYVGRLSEEKGIIQLLKLFSKLPKQRLIVIGDGPLNGEVKKFRRYPNIIIKNFVSEKVKYAYMRKALFTIIPSLAYEQGPLVLIESYTNGTPVLVPKFTSFIERVKEKKTGLFYRYDDEVDLKQKLLEIIEGKYNVNKMRIFSKKEYGKIYSAEIYYVSLLKAYNNLISLY